MCCQIVWFTGTDVSQQPAVYIFRTKWGQGSRRFPKVVPINHTTWCHIPDDHDLNNSVIAKRKLLWFVGNQKRFVLHPILTPTSKFISKNLGLNMVFQKNSSNHCWKFGINPLSDCICSITLQVWNFSHYILWTQEIMEQSKLRI